MNFLIRVLIVPGLISQSCSFDKADRQMKYREDKARRIEKTRVPKQALQ